MLIRSFRLRTTLVACAWAVLAGGIINLLGGCAAVMPVAGDVVGPAIEQSAQILSRGKVESFQPMPLDEAVTAVRKAADEMGLKQVHESKHPDQLKLTYVDDRKQQIVVTVVRRTSKVSAIHADVGIFGVEGWSPLVMRKILDDLPHARTSKSAQP